ncbi:putative ribosomally synthesized peptide with SipW-like signal peptide [Symbiobacterium terraclitae]|uniref:Ribosomally synthesized peptide with SipW-like signal peptide n=1 Tax=Symbiobacterium terraclitae TaxID=557451 RepID=A0ABS4JNS2_9FIRM|nr:SipW-dependent-type signal peptide-containing protein [Symbiobacterium terraclitae]MBP2017183.1 putative ribosomally synthesized peptide with SipW-like signal peptide [Symbiobacterium terraclitae]
MNKKLLLTMGAAAAIAAVSAGGTLALFTDSKSASADFVAGTLCLDSERNDGDTVPGPMFYITAEQGRTTSGAPGLLPTGVWAPGDSHTRTLTVYNGNRPECKTSMDAWLTAVEARLTEGIADQYVALASQLNVVVKTPQGGGPDVVVAEAPLSDFLAGPVTILYPDGDKIPLAYPSNRHMKFEVAFDRDAGNEYQGKTLVVDFVVHAEQQRNNR